MATLLYFGKDHRIKEMADQFFKETLAESGEVNTIVQMTEAPKLNDAFVAMAFDLLLFQQAEMDGTPIEYLHSFRKKYPRVTAPMILVGDEKAQPKIMSYLEAGFADYIVFPPDRPLLIEKIVIFCTGKRDRGNRQVYSQIQNQPADISRSGALEELSEFDCQIKTAHNVPINDLAAIYSRAFSDEGLEILTVLGRCYECEQHPKEKGYFLAKFYFVGMTADLLTNIRKNLRKSYISNKLKP